MKARRVTHRPQCSSFLGFIFRILSGNPKQELLWGLWVLEGYCRTRVKGLRFRGFRADKVALVWFPGFCCAPLKLGLRILYEGCLLPCFGLLVLCCAV